MIVSTLNLTFTKKIGIAVIDSYMEKLSLMAKKMPEFDEVTEFFHIVKNSSFETEFHMDCHRRPQVTLYALQSGATSFYLVHPLIGYYLLLLFQYNLHGERQKAIAKLEKSSLGHHLILKPGEAALINPGWSHYVWVPGDGCTDVSFGFKT